MSVRTVRNLTKFPAPTCGWRIANTIRNYKQLAGLITVAISPTLTPMKELLTLFLHLVVTVARLVGPGGARSIVAESLLMSVLSRCRSWSNCFAEGNLPSLSADARHLSPRTERSGTQHAVVRGAKQMPADTKQIVYLAVHRQEPLRLLG